jgi:hypothetical protein
VPDWKLEKLDFAIFFLEAEGFRFYIPAYMCWSLKNWRTSDSNTPDSLIGVLDLSAGWPAERFELLNRAQSEAVYGFLAFFDRYSGEARSGEAIRSYWHQFKKKA